MKTDMSFSKFVTQAYVLSVKKDLLLTAETRIMLYNCGKTFVPALSSMTEYLSQLRVCVFAWPVREIAI